MQIIQAGLDELERLVPLFDGYRQFYRQASDRAAARAFLHDRLSNSESIIFLAQTPEAGVGFCQLYPSFSSVSMRRIWILNDLFVAEHARGQGVASGLLNAARDWAISTKSKGLVLETEVTNLQAQRLYEQHGWQKTVDEYFYSLSV
ncbi:GNAT family N-acetyltransferase [Herpetosiphon giganteus]|uniref:GNAT family N-acetyltransferase n=1 Tax=Herpetosiphon giganteus TaxID=2029754 RepID=UPI00195D88BF|nr:GNAT family N-acetyltransferase [Herpetosiphon giganteus]MBM7845533.1 GNAT superfamily N-acetyltransferase [Herpetosiphon giganteus]